MAGLMNICGIPWKIYATFMAKYMEIEGSLLKSNQNLSFWFDVAKPFWMV